MFSRTPAGHVEALADAPSGTSASPRSSAILRAIRGEPPGRRRTPVRRAPRRAPRSSRGARSDRAPTRPAKPTTSPARTLDAPARARRARSSSSTCRAGAPRGRPLALVVVALELAPDHHRRELLLRQPLARDAPDGAPVAEHDRPVGELEDLGEPMGDEDDGRAAARADHAGRRRGGRLVGLAERPVDSSRIRTLGSAASALPTSTSSRSPARRESKRAPGSTWTSISSRSGRARSL